jgi:phytoene synthase
MPLSPADAALCERWIAVHSRSFSMASRLLPRRVRHASWALYAFCRRTDDAADEGEQGQAALRRIEALDRRLDQVYPDRDPAALPSPAAARDPALDPIDRSYALIATEHGIPRGAPAALLEGMRMDATDARYRTMDDLLVYCFRVASTVGLMMTRVMGPARPDATLRACELGVGMQLTNIARDVGEDARRGRVYLPDDLLAACQTNRDSVLTADRATWPLREATRRLLDVADRFYDSSERGIALLPADCRLAIASSRHIYAAIGDDLAAHGYDSITRRAHTSAARKLALVARAAPLALRPPEPPITGPADELLARLCREAGVPVG